MTVFVTEAVKSVDPARAGSTFWWFRIFDDTDDSEALALAKALRYYINNRDGTATIRYKKTGPLKFFYVADKSRVDSRNEAVRLGAKPCGPRQLATVYKKRRLSAALGV